MQRSEHVHEIKSVATMLRDDGFQFAAHNVEVIAEKVVEGSSSNAKTRLKALYTAASRFPSCAGIEPYLDLLQPLLH